MTTSDEDTWLAIPSLQNGSSATASLESLIELLRQLMASVRVTNPIARQDPDTAIEAMAEICLKFPIGLIRTVVTELQGDPEATWPTAGAMTGMLRDAWTSTEAESGVARSLKARVHRQNANINGWKYQQIIRQTKAGRAALKAGEPHGFLMSLVNGERDLPPEMACYPGTETPVDL